MKRIVLSLSVLAFLVLAGCSAYGGSREPQKPPPPAAAGGIAITASYPKFQPNQIEAAKEKATRLDLTSSDVSHTFTVDDLGINISIPAGKSVSQDITAARSGAFAFYCAVPGHRQAGMEGKLTVK